MSVGMRLNSHSIEMGNQSGTHLKCLELLFRKAVLSLSSGSIDEDLTHAGYCISRYCTIITRDPVWLESSAEFKINLTKHHHGLFTWSHIGLVLVFWVLGVVEGFIRLSNWSIKYDYENQYSLWMAWPPEAIAWVDGQTFLPSTEKKLKIRFLSHLHGTDSQICKGLEK